MPRTSGAQREGCEMPCPTLRDPPSRYRGTAEGYGGPFAGDRLPPRILPREFVAPPAPGGGPAMARPLRPLLPPSSRRRPRRKQGRRRGRGGRPCPAARCGGACRRYLVDVEEAVAAEVSSQLGARGPEGRHGWAQLRPRRSRSNGAAARSCPGRAALRAPRPPSACGRLGLGPAPCPCPGEARSGREAFLRWEAGRGLSAGRCSERPREPFPPCAARAPLPRAARPSLPRSPVKRYRCSPPLPACTTRAPSSGQDGS